VKCVSGEWNCNREKGLRVVKGGCEKLWSWEPLLLACKGSVRLSGHMHA